MGARGVSEMGVLPSWLLPLLQEGEAASTPTHVKAGGSEEASPRDGTPGRAAAPPSRLWDTTGAGWGVKCRGKARPAPDTATTWPGGLTTVSDAELGAPLPTREAAVPAGCSTCTAGKARYTHLPGSPSPSSASPVSTADKQQ